jgi:hypothetical protein
MKIQYIFSLIVLLVVCGSSQNIHAEDFEFKTTLMKEVAKTVPARVIPGCNGGSDVTIPAQNYTGVEIMATPADFTVVSFRVYYSDDLSTPLYNYLNNTPGAVNFNATTGEIRFVMTGIAQTRKELTARVYLNDGNGAIFEEKIFFTSQAKTGPPVGSIMPFYGTAAAAATLELGGWFLCDGRSIASIDNNVLFPDEKTALQNVIGSGNLPDLRGLFLRGIDPAGTYDPSANRAVGNVQTSQIQGHTHNYDKASSTTESASANIGLNTPTGACAAGPFTVLVPTASATDAGHLHNITHTTAQTSSAGSGGNDTRPTNAAVNYLIKVRH